MNNSTVGPSPMSSEGIAALPADHLLTADGVAKKLATTPRAVYDFARRSSDPLPVVKLGRVRRFRPADVDGWIERQR